MRRRFSATAWGSSWTCAPTFKDAQGPTLTPPPRSVNTARTLSGTGQSGRSALGPDTAGMGALIGSQHADQGLHVCRQGRLPRQGLAAHRVVKPELRGVQGLAAKGIERRPQLIRRTGRIAPARAIDRI